ncbi:protein FANTASTIC FOUR 1-like [Macadamia integrifolia]|uniref:protein FANTASTIC FOUR 1-like n=1 Tax=Macadamia integrifolia TaxID=60698 RepID=UPI001C528BDA|nr:protein FANTASTIC FOUR 1-like [Macadamia integrifolia]
MMSFCKKTVHSLLSLSQSTSTSDYPSHHHHHCRHIPSISGCFCLIAGDTPKNPNVVVLESATIKPTSTPVACKKDSTTFVSNGSCTESLGFESSDYLMEESLKEEELWWSKSTSVRSRWKTTVEKIRTQETNFPPPLPSLNQNGQPSFYLKPLRRNGRLELTEVRIERPDIFKASRQDGRLRLQLVKSEPQHPSPPYQDCDQLEEQEPLPLSSPPPPPPPPPHHHHHHQQEKEEEIIGKQGEDEISEEEEEEEGRRLRQWNLEGIRWRCQEMNNHRPHHHLLYGATIV